MMTNTGQALIGGDAVTGTATAFNAYDPTLGTASEPVFHTVDAQQIDRACVLAQSAFDAYRATNDTERAAFLEAIAAQIVALGDELIVRAMAESGLPRVRLEGERGRTVGQLKLFADLLREGSWRDMRIDSALPERTPPRPDLRMRLIGLGPVAVFGASNFPLAFSVAGGDTAAALAAGCPVVVKSHPAHLGTSELVGRAIQKAVADSGLPEGVFSLVVGAGNAIGEALVAHPAIKSVGFTGSRRGGLALIEIASRRREPIPVFAEMSSINPFFVLPGALAARAESLANGFVDSVTLGVGQFCTSPGLVLALEGPHLQAFIDYAVSAFEKKGAETMLTAGIAAAYQEGIARRDESGVERIATGAESDASCPALPALYTVSAEKFLATPQLEDEIFGPTSLIVTCRSEDEMLDLARRIEGQLTVTLQMESDDVPLARRLLPILERKAGRILANGFPTGVEVSYAMVHGGPYPATSDSRATSVGAMAI